MPKQTTTHNNRQQNHQQPLKTQEPYERFLDSIASGKGTMHRVTVVGPATKDQIMGFHHEDQVWATIAMPSRRERHVNSTIAR